MEDLAAGYGDGTARLWDVATRQVRSSLTGDTNPVSTVAFSPDGTTLATGSWDGTVRLWDLAARQLIGTPFTISNATSIYSTSSQTAWVNSVAFSPTGTTLAAATLTGIVQLWDVSYLTHTIPYLCGSAGRSLTRAEWAQATQRLAYQNICP